MALRVSVIGRGTFYGKLIEACNDNVMRLNRNADVIYNWGLAGEKFRSFFRKYPRYSNYPVYNQPVNQTKWTQLCVVRDNTDVPTLPSGREQANGMLFKPDFSLGGRHIEVVHEGFRPPVSGYYQQFIPGHDRKYELRVHASRFRNEADYLVQKRVNDNLDAVTWNHHTGGRFITVNEPRKYDMFIRAQAYSTAVLNALGVDGAGIDYLVDRDGRTFFLEANFSLGLRLEATFNYWVDTLNTITEREEV